MAADTDFGDVTLLMHMDGSNDGTSFVDVIGKTLSINGAVVTKTATKKFGTASAYWSGSGSAYLSFTSGTSMDPGGTGDFTIEAWVNFNSIPTSNAEWYLLQSTAANPYLAFQVYGSTPPSFRLKYLNSAQSMPTVTSDTFSLSTGQWYHVAVCRSGNTLRFFLDGAEVSSHSFNVTFASQTSHTYRIGFGAGSAVSWYLDDLRVTMGTGRYAAAFDVPTEAFPDSAATVVDLYASQEWAIEVPHISGTITESSDITDWDITAQRADSGALVRRITVTGSAYDIGLATLDPVFVALTPSITAQWAAGAAFSEGDYVIGSDPVTVPYLYKCTAAGTSDAAEPSWPTSGTVTDNDITWTCQGRLTQPLLQGPLMP